MNIFGGLFMYLMVGGLIFGLAANSKYEECGYPIDISTNDSVIAMVTWPIAVGMAITLDDGVMKKSGCKINEGKS